MHHDRPTGSKSAIGYCDTQYVSSIISAIVPVQIDEGLAG